MLDLLPKSGTIFFKDEYGVIYDVAWETVTIGTVEMYDFTTITKSPHVPGQPDTGFVKNKQLFRRGVCTTHRQILMPSDEGYIVMAEGVSQVICVFQTTFHCMDGPTDPFAYHVDCALSDEVEVDVYCGTRFADPEIGLDSQLEWPTVNADGSITYTADKQPFQFVDVWSNDESLVYECDPTGT